MPQERKRVISPRRELKFYKEYPVNKFGSVYGVSTKFEYFIIVKLFYYLKGSSVTKLW